MYYWGFHPGVVEQSTRPLVARCGWPRLGGCQSREDNLSWGGVGAGGRPDPVDVSKDTLETLFAPPPRVQGDRGGGCTYFTW